MKKIKIAEISEWSPRVGKKKIVLTRSKQCSSFGNDVPWGPDGGIHQQITTSSQPHCYGLVGLRDAYMRWWGCAKRMDLEVCRSVLKFDQLARCPHFSTAEAAIASPVLYANRGLSG